MAASGKVERPDWVVSLRDAAGRIVGAGILIDEGHVLTCDWVVNRALGRDGNPKAPSGEVAAGLPFLPDPAQLTARVADGGWFPGTESGDGNLAILEFLRETPTGTAPVPMSSVRIAAGSRFRTVGFPSGSLDGVWVRGNFRGPAGPEAWVRLEFDDAIPAKDQSGYGGAPVWGEDAGGVVGVLVAHDVARASRTAYMVPVDALEKYWPPLRDRFVGVSPEAESSLPSSSDAGYAVAREPESTSPVDRLTGFSSDDIGTVDHLGIAQDVNTLAALLASSNVKPPLSVGLFGAWGSGKSFFMRQLERRIASLAAAARAAETDNPPRQTLFCGSVVQITLNAWHYVDANLWASLVTRIFEGLDEHLDADPDNTQGKDYRELLGRLETSRALLREAERARDVARAALERAEEQRDLHRYDRDRRTLGEVVRSHPELADAAAELGETLGLNETLTSLGEIRQATGELRHLDGRLRRAWRASGAGDGRARRRLVAVLVATSVLVAALFTWLISRHEPVAATASFLVSALTGVTAVVSALLKRSRDALRAAGRVLEADDPALVSAERTVEAEQERVRRYEQEVEALRRFETPSLYRFINERYTSPDYRQHLGIVSLVQRDFQALSDLLLRPPARGRAESLPRIDRIILYIDDLDRCPSARVVQVLQAVHLLLAFPLFVVVVGVDSRWLERSLRREYATILTAADDEPDSSEAVDYWASTPQSYLEKIFQISFWLRAMEPTGFSTLVRSLLEELPVPAGPASERRTPDGDAAQDPDRPPQPSDGESDHAPPPPTSRAIDGGGRRDITAKDADGIDLTPRTLIIREDERAFMEALAPVIATPRAAKRLVNLYRLLKVSAGDHGVSLLEGDGRTSGQHQAALLLLAITVGFPGQAVALLRALRDTQARTWPAFVEELRPQPWNDATAAQPRNGVVGSLTAAQALPWRRLCQALDGVAGSLTATDIEPFVSWLDAVGRFSFGTGRVLAAQHREA